MPATPVATVSSYYSRYWVISSTIASGNCDQKTVILQGQPWTQKTKKSNKTAKCLSNQYAADETVTIICITHCCYVIALCIFRMSTY